MKKEGPVKDRFDRVNATYKYLKAMGCETSKLSTVDLCIIELEFQATINKLGIKKK
jgi:hypothetical protein